MKNFNHKTRTYKSAFQIIGTLILLLSISLQSKTQGWERIFADSIDIYLGEIIIRPDGGYTIINDQDVFSGPNNMYIDTTQILSTDQGGELLWLNQTLDSILVRDILQTSDGGYILIGSDTYFTNGVSGVRIVKLDGQGQSVWQKSFVPNQDYERFWGWKGLLLSDGSFLVGGQPVDFEAINDAYAFLMKLDADGNQLWYQEYDAAQEISFLLDIFPSNNGGFLLTGHKGVDPLINSSNNPFCLANIDADGNFLSSSTWSNAGHWMATTLLQDGNLLYVSTDTSVVDSTTGNSIKPEFIRLSKVDQQANLIWEKFISITDFDPNYAIYMEDVYPTADSGAIFITNDLLSLEVFVFKLDINGDIEWTKHFGDFDQSTVAIPVMLNDVKQTADGGYILSGWQSTDSFAPATAYLVRLDGDGQLYNNHITGYAYHDVDGNCQKDSLETGLGKYWHIKVTDGTLTWYGTTDTSGFYSVDVPHTTLDVTVDNLEPHPYISYCPASAQVSFTGNGQDATVDFGGHIEVYCPLLETSFFSWTMRRCFENKYMGKVCNIGTDTAFNATLEVELDPYLTYTSADIPLLSQNGQMLVFDLANLAPGECADFKIFFFLDCDAPVGLTHCSEAHAFPDTLCLPTNPIWDGSSITVSGECINEDSIHFNILNGGNGNMQQPSNLIVIEDHMIMFSDEFQLNAGAGTDTILEATGATYRLEADQCPGHPGNSYPSVTVEGCGYGQGLVISTGFVNMFPMDDEDYWLDIDCRENTGSYDPNQKEAFPEGFMDNHQIERNTDIEYLIQFQNTGTDTAFFVSVRDTLSPFLDPGSIRPGASSHLYEFELIGQGVVKFTFPNIMLPDSNVNEPMSHGFVSFRISQKPNIPFGSVIYNSAAIYFDFNAPIITNEVFHTIDTNFIEIINDVTDLTERFGELLVYPNPSQNDVQFELPEGASVKAVFSLYDAMGREMMQENFNGNRFLFSRNAFSAGIYFYKIEMEGVGVYSGKVVLK